MTQLTRAGANDQILRHAPSFIDVFRHRVATDATARVESTIRHLSFGQNDILNGRPSNNVALYENNAVHCLSSNRFT